MFDIKRYYYENSFTGKTFHSPLANVEDNYNTFWGRLSKQIRASRNYTCEKCGTQILPENTTTERYLEVHHRDKNKGNIMPDNLQVLCNRCHDEEHPNRPKK